LLIIFLSLFPRSVEILNGNPVFGSDQGRDYLVAKQIVVDHKFTLIGAEIGSGSAFIQGLFQGPFYYYLLSVAFFISNGNPVGAVVLMWILSLLTILFSFYFGRRLFGFPFGLVTALLIAVSPEFITQARFAWAPYPESVFILLSFYFTFLFSQNDNRKIFLAAFFAGFVYNFEFAIALPLCLSLIIYSIFYFRKKAAPYLFIFAGFFCAFIPMILFELRHKFMGLKGFVTYLVSHKSGVVSFYPNIQSLIGDHWKSFLYNVSNTFPNGDFLPPIIILLFLILSTVYLLTREKNKNIKNFILFLLLLIPVNFLVFYFLKNTIWDYYLTDLNFAYILLIVYVLFSSYRKKNYLLFIIFLFFFTGLVLLGINSALKTTIYDYSDYGGTAKLRGKIDAINFIYNNADGKKFNLLVFTPPVYTYPYDYLFWWYGQNKYGFIPENKKEGTFYLLIQPDSNKPWTYKGWLQTVIKTGRIESTITLPSGFIIQKRIVNQQ